MEKCQICGKENEEKITIIISPNMRINVCGECLNLYGNHEYDELIKRMKNNGGANGKDGKKK